MLVNAVRESVEESGLERRYWLRLACPIDEDDPGSSPTEFVLLRILAFADSDGAEELLPFLWGDDVDGVEVIDGAGFVGDESVMTRHDAIDEPNGNPVAVMEVTLRSGRLVGMVTAWDIALLDQGEDEEPVRPTVETVNALGKRLLTHIEDVADGVSPGHSGRVLRLDVDSPAENVRADRYNPVDGDPLRCYCETEEMLDDQGDDRPALGVVDGYEFAQVIPFW